MTVEFRRNRTFVKKSSIQGEEVKVMDDYKHLGVHLDNKLDWNCTTKVVVHYDKKDKSNYTS